VNSDVIENVISGMNNLEIAGQRLSVQRVPVSSAAVLLRPSKTSPKPAALNQFTSQQADGITPQWKPSRVIQLSNMTTEEDLSDDQLYEGVPSSLLTCLFYFLLYFLLSFLVPVELIEDIADECNTYAKVLSVIIPRFSENRDNIRDRSSAIGKVFVHVSELEGALKVMKAVSGRKFNGKIIEASYYPEELCKKQVRTIYFN
jgi:hypothetical protein